MILPNLLTFLLAMFCANRCPYICLFPYALQMKWLTSSEPLNTVKTARATALLFNRDGIMEMYLKQLVRGTKRTNQ